MTMALGWRRFLLLGWFLLVLMIQLRFGWETVEDLLTWRTYPSSELLVQTTDSMRTNLTGTFKKLGLEANDRLVRIGGTEVKSRGDVARRMARAAAGEQLPLDYATEKGLLKTVVYTVPAMREAPPTLGLWAMVVELNVVMPMLCIGLAFFVAWRRPNDRMAWMLLFGLYGLSQLARANGILRYASPVWLTIPGHFFMPFGTIIWPTAWLWFCIDFPDPRSRIKLLPWSRWVIGAPSLFFAVLLGVESILNAEFATQMSAQWIFRILMKIQGWLFAIPLIIGFANLVYKLRREKHRDARRRLRVLLAGLGLGLGPLVVAVGFGFERLPEYLRVTVVVLLGLVPITIAYVLIVQRAMDVGVVVRQGFQYAFARGGVEGLRALLLIALMLLVLVVGTDTTISRPLRLGAIALVFASILGLQAMAERLKRWVDRRFFREAVDAERVLLELGRQVRTMIEPDSLLAAVTHRVADALHTERVAALVGENGNYVTSQYFGFRAKPDTRLAKEGPIAQRLRIGTQRVYLDDPRSWVHALNAEEQRQLEQLSTELLLPIVAQDQMLGILSLGPKLSEEPYSGSDIRLLESVASQTGLALENSRLAANVAHEAAQRERLHSELAIAREVQERLLPKHPPQVPGLDIAGLCLPAQTIGGDYFDYLKTSTAEVGFAIGDIAGKGVPAALLMASLQSSLRGLIAGGVTALPELMTRLNRLVYEATPANRFATFFYGLYDPGTRRMRCASGGHNAALLVRADGAVEWVKPPGVALGLTAKSTYEEQDVTLEPGDRFVLYTDGVTEAMSAAREEFGDDRLVGIVKAHKDADAANTLVAISGAVAKFAEGQDQHDDLTLIVIRAVD